MPYLFYFLTAFLYLLFAEKSRNMSDNSYESSEEFLYADSSITNSESSKTRPSWGSMQTPESVLGRPKGGSFSMSPAPLNKSQSPSTHSTSATILNVGSLGSSMAVDKGLSGEQKELIEFAKVERKKNFVHMERVNGRERNILQGLELHARVFNADEQKKIVDCVYDFQRKGQKGQLRGTYTIFFLAFFGIFWLYFNRRLRDDMIPKSIVLLLEGVSRKTKFLCLRVLFLSRVSP